MQREKVTVMLTEEEFVQFQGRLVEMRQFNFALKEEISNLEDASKELPSLREELGQCEKQLSEARERQQKHIQGLKDDIAGLQKKAADQAEANSKRLSERITDITHQIAALKAETKEKSGKVEQLQHELRGYESRIHESSARINMFKQRVRRYEPLIQLLRKSRALPMYLEDLSARITGLKEANQANGNTGSEVDEKVRKLKRLRDDLVGELKRKNLEIDDTNVQLKEATLKIADANAEMERMKEENTNASAKLEHAKQATEAALKEKEAEVERIKGAKNAIELRLRETEIQRKKFEDKVDAIKSKAKESLLKYNAQVQELRKQLSIIKETGDDDTVPRVDKDLRAQITRVAEATQMYRDKTQMLNQAISLVEDEIKDKDISIQILCLKTTPTPEILAVPEFQQKQLLFEELVLQNRSLRKSFAEMTEEIVELKRQREAQGK